MLEKEAHQLNQRFSTQIPMARQMGLRITAWDGRSLRMDAPLAPNLNDKGTGFAGSLATLATFAGWAVATLLAEKVVGTHCEVAVFESAMSYLAPVTGDFYALVPVPATEVMQTFERSLAEGGRAKLTLTSTLFQDGVEKVRYRGRYAVRVGKVERSFHV
jgi:thioesterase domain-containing protein